MSKNPLLGMFNQQNPANQMIQSINQFKQNPQGILSQMTGGMPVNMGNPSAILQALAQKNPQIAQLIQGKDINNPQVVNQLCMDYCQRSGIDYNQFMQMLR